MAHHTLEDLLQRHAQPGRVQFFGGVRLEPAAVQVIMHTLDTVREIQRQPLDTQAAAMHDPMRAFLVSLGRPPHQKGMAITGVDIEKLEPTQEYSCAGAFTTGACLEWIT